MEHFLLFAKGLGVGVAVAAPVGPIGVLCIRRTLSDGTRTGLLSGLGAACADAFYGAVAAFGIASVAGFLLDYQDHLRVLGGVFLLVLAVRILARGPAGEASSPAWGQVRLAGAFASCFLLTLTNPMTILAFVAIFAGLGLVEHAASYAAAGSVVAGVFAGSALWWLALSGTAGWLRERVTPQAMTWINRVSSAIIAGFGIGVLGAPML